MGIETSLVNDFGENLIINPQFDYWQRNNGYNICELATYPEARGFRVSGGWSNALSNFAFFEVTPIDGYIDADSEL